MKCVERVLLVASACACFVIATAVSGFSYTPADVKRGEDLVSARDYKTAIELLVGLVRDADFCATNPSDTARAGMLLRDAYESNGEKSSVACKVAAESTKLALAQTWASLKKAEPDVKKRLEKIAGICQGHPQAFADFANEMLPKILTTASKADALLALDTVFAVYRDELAMAPHSTVPDCAFLSSMGSRYASLQEWKSAASVLGYLLGRIPAENESLKATALFMITEMCHLAGDSQGVIQWSKEALQARLTEDQQLEVSIFLVFALENTGYVDEAIQQLRSLIDHDKDAGRKVYWLTKVADIYFSAKEYSEAAKAFTELSKASKASSDTKARSLYYRSLCYWELGNDKEAVTGMQNLMTTGATEWAKKAKGQLYLWSQY